MNTLKKIRLQSGYTQQALADKTGLSLRTVQRLESGTKPPKGHSLEVLSAVLNVEPSALQQLYQNIDQINKKETTSIQLINLSALTFLGIPFGNLIFPLLLWRKNRETAAVDKIGRRIVNYQIIWSAMLCILLSLSPFIGRKFFSGIPVILYVLFVMYALNVVVICMTAIKLQRNKFNFLHLPLRLI